MKNSRASVQLFIATLILASLAYSSEKKLAQTGFQFLSVITDARAAAMAGAVTTVEMGSGSLFFNPAGMARTSGFIDITASQNYWIADITHNSATVALNPFKNRYGVLGLSLQYVDYGKMQGTLASFNEQGYTDTEIYNPTAFAIGIGYALSLSNQFSVGGQVKYAGQQLGRSIIAFEKTDSVGVKKNRAFATAFDFGTIFKTGFKSLVFGMSIRNFSNEIAFEEENFQLPLTFSMGIFMNVFDFFPGFGSNQTLYTSIDAAHPRSYPEYINLGIEYGLNRILFFRYGLMQNRDERASNFGVGIQYAGLAVDYAYTPFGIFDEVQRFTIRFSP